MTKQRALLEGERGHLQGAHRGMNQHQRERIIEIKRPAQPYTPRASTLTTRQHMDIRYASPTNLRRSPALPSGSISSSRVIPISVEGRARHQSPASRRDMISFSKAQAASSASATITQDKQTGQRENRMNQSAQKKATEEKTLKLKQASQESRINTKAETQPVRVLSPAMMSFSSKTETESKKHVWNEREKEKGSPHDEFKDNRRAENPTGPTEKKILDSVSVEEIIEKVIKPAGLEAKVCSSGDSTVRYHVEIKEQEDGTTKTQIVLESKVEEELDVSEDSALEELLGQGVKKVSLEDIENTTTGGMIKNLISSLQGGENLQNKSVNVEIIEEPVESYSDEELEVEQKGRSSFYEPSTCFQIEELENASHDTRPERSDDTIKSSLRSIDQFVGGSVRVQEAFRESGSPHFSNDQESNEYFVSTPDDNLSEPEEAGGIMSYGHYGVVDDLSDERYYQDESPPQRRVIVEESDESKYMSDDHSFAKESLSECIIEEEVRVSPVVQESLLGYLREESLEPKEQLKGALEKLQSSVSGPLKEELAFLSKMSNESPQKVAVKKVEQSSDNGTMTIVAELNVSQTLEDSGLLEADDDVSEEQIMAALRSSNLGLEKAFQEGAGEGYSIRMSREEVAHGGGLEGFSGEGGSTSEIVEKHIKLGPSEKSITFKMDVEGSRAEASSETPLKIAHEKRVAAVFLESPFED